jgi:hypothetical protein
MESREIAKELAVACLSHQSFVDMLAVPPVDLPKQPMDAQHLGKQVGEFYHAIQQAMGLR